MEGMHGVYMTMITFTLDKIAQPLNNYVKTQQLSAHTCFSEHIGQVYTFDEHGQGWRIFTLSLIELGIHPTYLSNKSLFLI